MEILSSCAYKIGEDRASVEKKKKVMNKTYCCNWVRTTLDRDWVTKLPEMEYSMKWVKNDQPMRILIPWFEVS